MIAWKINKKFGNLALNAKQICFICLSLQWTSTYSYSLEIFGKEMIQFLTSLKFTF